MMGGIEVSILQQCLRGRTVRSTRVLLKPPRSLTGQSLDQQRPRINSVEQFDYVTRRRELTHPLVDRAELLQTHAEAMFEGSAAAGGGPWARAWDRFGPRFRIRSTRMRS